MINLKQFSKYETYWKMNNVDFPSLSQVLTYKFYSQDDIIKFFSFFNKG